MNKQEWLTALKPFVEETYKRSPIPEQSSLLQEMGEQCQIIGGELIEWCNKRLRNILAERTVFLQFSRCRLRCAAC
jgi:hypothetical protein